MTTDTICTAARSCCSVLSTLRTRHIAITNESLHPTSSRNAKLTSSEDIIALSHVHTRASVRMRARLRQRLPTSRRFFARRAANIGRVPGRESARCVIAVDVCACEDATAGGVERRGIGDERQTVPKPTPLVQSVRLRVVLHAARRLRNM